MQEWLHAQLRLEVLFQTPSYRGTVSHTAGMLAIGVGAIVSDPFLSGNGLSSGEELCIYRSIESFQTPSYRGTVSHLTIGGDPVNKNGFQTPSYRGTVSHKTSQHTVA